MYHAAQLLALVMKNVPWWGGWYTLKVKDTFLQESTYWDIDGNEKQRKKKT